MMYEENTDEIMKEIYDEIEKEKKNRSKKLFDEYCRYLRLKYGEKEKDAHNQMSA